MAPKYSFGVDKVDIALEKGLKIDQKTDQNIRTNQMDRSCKTEKLSKIIKLSLREGYPAKHAVLFHFQFLYLWIFASNWIILLAWVG